jgi:hypothetical protein
MGLDGIQPSPTEGGCINMCCTRGSKHDLLRIFFQLYPLCCKPVLPIKMLLKGTAIEIGDQYGCMHNCKNRVYDMSLCDPKLVEVQLRHTGSREKIWSITFGEHHND